MLRKIPFASKPVYWKVNTPGLIRETINSNPTIWALKVPFQIFVNILAEVGERAAELNDPKLNALMCRLALYSISDPNNEESNPELAGKVIANGMLGRPV